MKTSVWGVCCSLALMFSVDEGKKRRGISQESLTLGGWDGVGGGITAWSCVLLANNLSSGSTKTCYNPALQMEHFLNPVQRKGLERSGDARKVIGRCHGRYIGARAVAAAAAADLAC